MTTSLSTHLSRFRFRPMATLLLSLRILLCLFFVFAAVKNLGGDETMAADFARWGYPSWFRVLTAVMQLVGGLALLVPATVPLGAGLLGVVLLGAVGTHLLHDPIGAVIPAVAFLVPVAALIVLRPGAPSA